MNTVLVLSHYLSHNNEEITAVERVSGEGTRTSDGAFNGASTARTQSTIVVTSSRRSSTQRYEAETLGHTQVDSQRQTEQTTSDHDGAVTMMMSSMTRDQSTSSSLLDVRTTVTQPAPEVISTTPPSPTNPDAVHDVTARCIQVDEAVTRQPSGTFDVSRIHVNTGDAVFFINAPLFSCHLHRGQRQEC